ncbi:MAG: outer membrane protein transport protein, partial [Pseudomonadaceae bacterium]|nr:outer membrane protein transport protein [Pseudomonadaceae bacterium]
ILGYALLASANWQDWSDFGQIAVEVDALSGLSTTVDANYKDTYHLSLGTQYQATPKLLWNAGVAYDTSAVSDSNRTVTVPMGEQWRLGTGVTYALDSSTDLNLSWDLVWMGDLPVDQSKTLSGERISGQYDAAWIQTLTGNATWRF